MNWQKLYQGCNPVGVPFVPYFGPTGHTGATGVTGATGQTGATGATGPERAAVLFRNGFFTNRLSPYVNDGPTGGSSIFLLGTPFVVPGPTGMTAMGSQFIIGGGVVSIAAGSYQPAMTGFYLVNCVVTATTEAVFPNFESTDKLTASIYYGPYPVNVFTLADYIQTAGNQTFQSDASISLSTTIQVSSLSTDVILLIVGIESTSEVAGIRAITSFSFDISRLA